MSSRLHHIFAVRHAPSANAAENAANSGWQVHTVKTKTPRNPLSRWTVVTGGAGFLGEGDGLVGVGGGVSGRHRRRRAEEGHLDGAESEGGGDQDAADL